MNPNETPYEAALREVEAERFREQVEACKARLRRPWWRRLIDSFPFTITIHYRR